MDLSQKPANPPSVELTQGDQLNRIKLIRRCARQSSRNNTAYRGKGAEPRASSQQPPQPSSVSSASHLRASANGVGFFPPSSSSGTLALPDSTSSTIVGGEAVAVSGGCGISIDSCIAPISAKDANAYNDFCYETEETSLPPRSSGTSRHHGFNFANGGDRVEIRPR